MRRRTRRTRRPPTASRRRSRSPRRSPRRPWGPRRAPGRRTSRPARGGRSPPACSSASPPRSWPRRGRGELDRDHARQAVARLRGHDEVRDPVRARVDDDVGQLAEVPVAAARRAPRAPASLRPRRALRSPRRCSWREPTGNAPARRSPHPGDEWAPAVGLHGCDPRAPGATPMTSPLVDSARRPLRQRFLLEPAPDNQLPQHGMRAVDAMRLIGEELVLDGIPMRNLATFVTTWMEPEAQRIIAENLHRNFIDHAEYPQTAEIEQRCIRMLADLFHAPGRDDGRAHAGLVRGDHARRAVAEVEVARAARGGGQGHGPAEPRLRRRRARRVGEVLPLLRRRAADHPAPAATSTRSGPRTSSRTSTRTRSASPPCSARRSPATPTTSSGSTTCSSACATRRGSTSRCTSTAASGGFVWPFLYPDSTWDFRLEQVRSINVVGPQVRARLPGHRLARLPRDERPPRGPRVLRELPRQARRDVHAELLDGLGDGARAVLQLRPLRPRGLPLHHGDDAGQRARRSPSGSRHRRVRADRATRTTSSSRWSPSSSRASTTTTSSTSPRSSPPSAAGWCRPTRCRRTPST